MKIQMYLDGILCDGKISKIDWFRSLFSIALHSTNWDRWEYFKITNIKGNPQYESWDYINVPAENINWKFFSFH